MTDTLTPSERSRLMSRVRSRDTGPELAVRRLVHRLGYRFRLHRRDLPGRPDLVFPGRGKVIFVHGCFWHRHTGCAAARIPRTRRAFWTRKLEGNRIRDRKTVRRLRRLSGRRRWYGSLGRGIAGRRRRPEWITISNR